MGIKRYYAVTAGLLLRVFALAPSCSRLTCPLLLIHYLFAGLRMCRLSATGRKRMPHCPVIELLRCPTGNTSISVDAICDGKADCPDAFDEAGCDSYLSTEVRSTEKNDLSFLSFCEGSCLYACISERRWYVEHGRLRSDRMHAANGTCLCRPVNGIIRDWDTIEASSLDTTFRYVLSCSTGHFCAFLTQPTLFVLFHIIWP